MDDPTPEQLEAIKAGGDTPGFHFTCPNCEHKHTFYSAGYEGWVCLDCGIVFQWYDTLRLEEV